MVIIVHSEKRHNSVNSLRSSLKSLSGSLHIDPLQYASYQNPNSCGFLDIILTRFAQCDTDKGKRRITLQFVCIG